MSVIPVAVHGFTWSAVFLALLNVIVGGGMGVAVIKVWPRIKEIGVKARRDDMDDLREQIGELRGSIVAMQGQVLAANDKAHKSEMIVVTVVAAFQLAMGELEKLDPDNKVLKQARDMMSVAMTGDFGLDKSIIRLAAVQGAKDGSKL